MKRPKLVNSFPHLYASRDAILATIFSRAAVAVRRVARDRVLWNQTAIFQLVNC